MQSTKMSHSTTNSHLSLSLPHDSGLNRLAATCKQFLNGWSALTHRLAERRELATLSPRQLEDIGMTDAERDSLLRW